MKKRLATCLPKRFLLFAELAGFDKDLDDCVTALDIAESELKSIIDTIDS